MSGRLTLRHPLHGSRVTLRPPCCEEMPFIRTLWADEETMRPLGGPVTLTDEQAECWFTRMIDPGDEHNLYCLIFDEQNTPIGEVSFHRMDWGTMTADFNIKIIASRRRQGYGNEAMRLLLDYFFYPVGGQLMLDDLALNNLSGQAVLRRFGFEHDPSIKEHYRMFLTREKFRQLYPGK